MNTTITKEINVTITVGKDGSVNYDFYEAESGDTYGIATTLKDIQFAGVGSQLGAELCSWAFLMADELDEMGEDEA